MFTREYFRVAPTFYGKMMWRTNAIPYACEHGGAKSIKAGKRGSRKRG